MVKPVDYDRQSLQLAHTKFNFCVYSEIPFIVETRQCSLVPP